MISKQSDLYQIFKQPVQFTLKIPRENSDPYSVPHSDMEWYLVI